MKLCQSEPPFPGTTCLRCYGSGIDPTSRANPSPSAELTRTARFFAALWLSEGWYESWRIRGRLHHKARGLVLFDRALNGEEGRS